MVNIWLSPDGRSFYLTDGHSKPFSDGSKHNPKLMIQYMDESYNILMIKTQLMIIFGRMDIDFGTYQPDLRNILLHQGSQPDGHWFSVPSGLFLIGVVSGRNYRKTMEGPLYLMVNTMITVVSCRFSVLVNLRRSSDNDLFAACQVARGLLEVQDMCRR